MSDTPAAAPPTAAELAALRTYHRPMPLYGDVPYYCHGCGRDWPCDAARLLAAYDEAIAARDVARHQLWESESGRLADERDNARDWAAAWKRAATHFRFEHHHARWQAGYWQGRTHAVEDRLPRAARVVEAARALDLAGVGGVARALCDALAAYDAAAREVES